MDRRKESQVASEIALFLVNEVKSQMALLARALVVALEDGKVSPFEGLLLSLKGTTLATTVLTFLQQADPLTRREVLYVLEHGQVVVPEGVPRMGGES
jgi:hypothetical protein